MSGSERQLLKQKNAFQEFWRKVQKAGTVSSLTNNKTKLKLCSAKREMLRVPPLPTHRPSLLFCERSLHVQSAVSPGSVERERVAEEAQAEYLPYPRCSGLHAKVIQAVTS